MVMLLLSYILPWEISYSSLGSVLSGCNKLISSPSCLNEDELGFFLHISEEKTSIQKKNWHMLFLIIGENM